MKYEINKLTAITILEGLSVAIKHYREIALKHPDTTKDILDGSIEGMIKEHNNIAAAFGYPNILTTR